ncbi:CheW domain-containing protein [Pseudomonas sp. WAC2]|uniref:CheW domain-containing protein n=1 Tax=Pseudomonas sp. WAC2 TaxID=3055057 RepID=UPI0025B1BBE9|nr:CheW domain-containing protein [Pseudomonas sp. WAC2]MDN3236371.1 CheW domain-containing protein [Pseudomonas sp. WAC2]
MNRSTSTEIRPQLALQSYLDALLMEATLELPVETPAVLQHEAVIVSLVEVVPVAAPDPVVPTAQSVSLDEFEAAVREEKARDAQVRETPAQKLAEPASLPVVPVVKPVVAEPEKVVDTVIPLRTVKAVEQQVQPFKVSDDGRPEWAEEPFECLLFDVAGLTLAVPLICLGTIHSLEGRELTPLFGQSDWFLGILPSPQGNLKVLDAARWVMPERYREDFKEGLRFVISVEGYDWGIAVHQVSRSIRLDPAEVKWRTQRSQRPWLAGTVIEHMCALLDVSALAALIESGAAKQRKQ